MLNKLPRWLVLVSTLILPIAYFAPVWQIYLWAPQYPEGLSMQIWMHKLTGDIGIISGLNHYIGMAEINESMFPELKYLPWIVGAIIALGLLTFFVNKKSLIITFAVVLLAFAVIAMFDMWLWGYKYGHNLDPHAAIKIEGESYQPPLIGYKQLLNFTALSMPHTAGWALFGSGGLAIIAAILSMRKKRHNPSTYFRSGLIVLMFSTLASCNSEPEPLRYGEDDCNYCGMKLMDTKYGAEFITDKGKIYKFDDLNCLFGFISESSPEMKSAQILVADFSTPGTLIDAQNAHYLKSSDLRSPMGFNVAAFQHADSLNRYSTLLPGENKNWNALSPQAE